MEEARFFVYRLGHLLIDNEHLGILSRMDRAKIAAVADSTDHLKVALEEILSSTKSHFSHEEALMDSSGYPYRDWHKVGHQKILEKLDALSSKFFELSKRTYAERFFSESLEKIILTHIDEQDRQLVEWMSKQ